VNINLPEVFFCPLFQAAALGQLGHTRDARSAFASVRQLCPDLPARAYEVIGRLIKAEGEVKHLVEGLQKAGLQVERHACQDSYPFLLDTHQRTVDSMKNLSNRS
jgi:hypothetical protein